MRFVHDFFLKGRGKGYTDNTTATAVIKETIVLRFQRIRVTLSKGYHRCDSSRLNQSTVFRCTLLDKFPLFLKSLSTQFQSSCRGLHHLISTNDEALLASCRAFIPSLTNALHKGQAGRIGVLGGSEEYTGAPYFAAISALKVGADIAHVFCAKPAAAVIKTYSPELIVHPLLDTDNAVDAIMEWVPRMHSFVIGPGLGRDPKILNTVGHLIERLKEADRLFVLDADALFLITEKPELIKGYPKVILTPNSVEFARLCTAVLGEEVKPAPSASAEKVRELAIAFGHVTILHKGATDVASNGRLTVCCAGGGSNRRCGGQGDLLAGSLAVLFHWATGFGDRAAAAAPPELLAVYAACRLTRECARLAYSQHGRSTTTTDMVRLIHQAFSFLFGP
ncbi:ATP-dependent (S)-NAD(P)H-hydrate dehydratase [Orchesella cincta]|uniref:ATP-dependent (S)-NAD(P)H-hydrate dehydratase n=1 Tax=Orchesella cincta TaxID=48709 RepID=A0A1D2MZB6_ORCCI|nr:ATP-dependent (S)-NAD(P)H-hydrate dehydratase [Orchesella cincta]